MYASEKVMRDYLSHLLDDEAPEPVLQPSEALRPIKPHPHFKEQEQTDVQQIEKLLSQVEQHQQVEKITQEIAEQVDVQEVHQEVVEIPVVAPAPVKAVADVIPNTEFQALFFEVAGLVLAVPLHELGGIHNLTEINSLFGKPNWFKGVMLNRDKKLNVVDSALWVMPERYNTDMEQAIEYQYLITLGMSDWGLTAEKLVGTATIHPNDVKWRNGPGKRPWLFGTIKEKMCALLHVSDLIAMLEQGLNARKE